MNYMSMLRVVAALGALLFVLQTLDASAQQPQLAAEPTKRLEPVEVTGGRDSTLISYAKAYELLTKFTQLPNRKHLDLAFYFTPVDEDKYTPSALRISLQGETVSQPVAVDDDWRIHVPISDAAAKEGADFVLNQDPSKFRRRVVLQILPPPKNPVPLSYYFDALEEIAAAERKLLFLLMPAKTQLAFVYNAGVRATAEIRCEGSLVERLSVRRNARSIAISLDPSWRRKDCELTFDPIVPRYTIALDGR